MCQVLGPDAILLISLMLFRPAGPGTLFSNQKIPLREGRNSNNKTAKRRRHERASFEKAALSNSPEKISGRNSNSKTASSND